MLQLGLMKDLTLQLQHYNDCNDRDFSHLNGIYLILPVPTVIPQNFYRYRGKCHVYRGFTEFLITVSLYRPLQHLHAISNKKLS